MIEASPAEISELLDRRNAGLERLAGHAAVRHYQGRQVLFAAFPSGLIGVVFYPAENHLTTEFHRQPEDYKDQNRCRTNTIAFGQSTTSQLECKDAQKRPARDPFVVAKRAVDDLEVALGTEDGLAVVHDPRQVRIAYLRTLGWAHVMKMPEFGQLSRG